MWLFKLAVSGIFIKSVASDSNFMSVLICPLKGLVGCDLCATFAWQEYPAGLLVNILSLILKINTCTTTISLPLLPYMCI